MNLCIYQTTQVTACIKEILTKRTVIKGEVPYPENNTYSKLSIKRPVLLNDLVLIFPKTTRSISEKNDCTVLFQSCHGQFLVSIKRPGLDIRKKCIKPPVLYFFLNSRSLKRPGLIIESLE